MIDQSWNRFIFRSPRGVQGLHVDVIDRRWHITPLGQRPWLSIVCFRTPLLPCATLVNASYQIRKLRVAHAPGMPGTFSPPPRVSDTDMHHGTCVTHVLWCMPGSLTSSFLWSRWRGKRSRHSRHMRKPQFYVSGKRPMGFVRRGDINPHSHEAMRIK